MQHHKKVVICSGNFPTRSDQSQDECRRTNQSCSFYVLWTLPERLDLFHRAELVVGQVSYMLLLIMLFHWFTVVWLNR